MGRKTSLFSGIVLEFSADVAGQLLLVNMGRSRGSRGVDKCNGSDSFVTRSVGIWSAESPPKHRGVQNCTFCWYRSPLSIDSWLRSIHQQCKHHLTTMLHTSLQFFTSLSYLLYTLSYIWSNYTKSILRSGDYRLHSMGKGLGMTAIPESSSLSFTAKMKEWQSTALTKCLLVCLRSSFHAFILSRSSLLSPILPALNAGKTGMGGGKRFPVGSFRAVQG